MFHSGLVLKIGWLSHKYCWEFICFLYKLRQYLVGGDVESLEPPGEVVLKLQPDREHLARPHRLVGLEVHLLPLLVLQQPGHPQLLVDRLAGDVDVLDVEDNEVRLLGDLEDQLDDPLDSQGGEIGTQFQVVADGTDENWQPADRALKSKFCIVTIKALSAL